MTNVRDLGGQIRLTIDESWSNTTMFDISRWERTGDLFTLTIPVTRLPDFLQQLATDIRKTRSFPGHMDLDPIIQPTGSPCTGCKGFGRLGPQCTRCNGSGIEP